MNRVQAAAYREALDADASLTHVLDRAYGHAAGDARYDERATATDELKKLMRVFIEKADALRKAL